VQVDVHENRVVREQTLFVEYAFHHSAVVHVHALTLLQTHKVLDEQVVENGLQHRLLTDATAAAEQSLHNVVDFVVDLVERLEERDGCFVVNETAFDCVQVGLH